MPLKLFLHSLFLFTALAGETFQWQLSNTPEFDWIHPSHEGIAEDANIVLSDEAKEALHEISYIRIRSLEEKEWSSPSLFHTVSAIQTQAWTKPADLGDDIWEKVLPYLMPLEHPLKPKLDSLFQKKRITASFEAMEKAGFICLKLRNWDNVLVAAHHKLKGYLVKTYLDDQFGITEDYELLKRIKGANAIRQAIQDLHYEHFFKVPHKWLYVLPDHLASEPGCQRKHFVLVVEDMRLVSDIANPKKWKTKITKERLKCLYLLLNHVGLKDSVFIFNIPFAKDGKIALIDTEHYHDWPVPFHRLTHFLNPEMQEYWNLLIHTNGSID